MSFCSQAFCGGAGCRSRGRGYPRLYGRVYRVFSQVRNDARPGEPVGVLVFCAVVLFDTLSAVPSVGNCRRT